MLLYWLLCIKFIDIVNQEYSGNSTPLPLPSQLVRLGVFKKGDNKYLESCIINMIQWRLLFSMLFFFSISIGESLRIRILVKTKFSISLFSMITLYWRTYSASNFFSSNYHLFKQFLLV